MTIQFIFKSYTVQNLALVVQLFKSVFEDDKIQVYRYPTKIQKLTVLKSPHVHKKSREQFETRTHKMHIALHAFDAANFDKIIKCVQSFQIVGVQLQVRIFDSTDLYKTSTCSIENV